KLKYKYKSTNYFVNSIPAGDTIDTQDILFLLHNLSSGSPFMLLLLPLCNITGHAIRSAKSRHRPVMTDDMLMWSRSGTATPR
ncbi:TPA: hypothetical protein ACIAMR_004414, partial [Salmonella enterica subsp. enterica serovar Aberdeen]